MRPLVFMLIAVRKHFAPSLSHHTGQMAATKNRPETFPNPKTKMGKRTINLQLESEVNVNCVFVDFFHHSIPLPCLHLSSQISIGFKCSETVN